MKKYFIYTLSRKGVAFYIGLTTNTSSRLRNHKGRYGHDIELDVVDTCFCTLDTACAVETSWIKKYKDLGVILINHKQSKEVRRSRSYKSYDDVYDKAMIRAKKSGNTLAAIIEHFIMDYSEGAHVGYDINVSNKTA